MPYSVVVTLDAVVGATVEKMWDALSSVGIASEGQVQGNHPHITLGVYHDVIKREAAFKAIRDLAAGHKAADVALSGCGIFPGQTHALCAIPIVTGQLLALHRELHASVPSDNPHYAPDRWVPHVTLARELDASIVAAGVNALMPVWQSPRGRLARIELISFVPVIVLEAHSFGSRH